jgi:lipopolysaccharide transport system ATP-binding protein
MNGQTVIRAEGLGKKYMIGASADKGRYLALRDVLAQVAKSAWRKVRKFGHSPTSSLDPEEFWALQNINFDLKSGEVLGIIGRNGAGKSTLLKILSRITEPSMGRVTIRGRVASLLEVGTGFHPELTGRENIYLNGAILGMKRNEIRRKFDEIVAFAEVERFLDTPVKRYSSGMYMRLAFAVAAHLEPEILVVDEVLAVGDAEFQKKCLNKMGEVASEGRTVLFVSHNLAAIAELCTRALLLRKGEIDCIGTPDEVVAAYIEQSNTSKIGEWVSHTSRDLTVRIRVSNDSLTDVHQSGSPLDLSITSQASRDIRLTEFCLTIENLRGQRVGLIDFRLADDRITLCPTEVTYLAHLENSDFVPGTYVLKVWMSGPEVNEELELGTIEFVEAPRPDRLSLFPPYLNGIVNFRGSVKKLPSTDGRLI